ncbi:hypothetical protein HPP92_028691, partial [Vanilla planifolia]
GDVKLMVIQGLGGYGVLHLWSSFTVMVAYSSCYSQSSGSPQTLQDDSMVDGETRLWEDFKHLRMCAEEFGQVSHWTTMDEQTTKKWLDRPHVYVLVPAISNSSADVEATQEKTLAAIMRKWSSLLCENNFLSFLRAGFTPIHMPSDFSGLHKMLRCPRKVINHQFTSENGMVWMLEDTSCGLLLMFSRFLGGYTCSFGLYHVDLTTWIVRRRACSFRHGVTQISQGWH